MQGRPGLLGTVWALSQPAGAVPRGEGGQRWRQGRVRVRGQGRGRAGAMELCPELRTNLSLCPEPAHPWLSPRLPLLSALLYLRLFPCKQWNPSGVQTFAQVFPQQVAPEVSPCELE